MKHYVKAEYVELKSGGGRIEYKDIKRQKNGRYIVHKTREKTLHSNNNAEITLASDAYLINCIEHNIIKAKKIKANDDVIAYMYLDDISIEILNNAKKGKNIFKELAKIDNSEKRTYVRSFLLTLFKIYKKTNVEITFKKIDEVNKMSFLNAYDYRYREKFVSYMVTSSINRTEEESKELHERFKHNNHGSNLNYHDIINQ